MYCPENNAPKLDMAFEASLAKEENDFDTKIEQESQGTLVGEEAYDRFEALARPSALFLQGVDDMSTKDISSYCPSLKKVEWIDDSSCNMVFETSEEAQEALLTLMVAEDRGAVVVDHRQLVAAKPFLKEEEGVEHKLFIRVATDEDVKERGARQRSRYYLIHGKEEEEENLSEERKVARQEHQARMRKSGGDGRSVFERLGNKRNEEERRRSASPDREETRSTERHEI
ncbi:hypothetical protein BD770DRAFT_445332 [Pilaira anomala]|nr:hypothetical protein BD770DRAFT_445332 [Pilaira anomala]